MIITQVVQLMQTFLWTKVFYMSMQYAGHGLNTNSTTKRKSTIVINDTFKQDYYEYNKLMKRIGSKGKSFQEYVEYRQGNSKFKQRAVKATEAPYMRPSPKVPSGMGIGVADTKRDEKVYTGNKLMGIATMHKSNMVPVFKQEDAEEISRMSK